MKGFREGLQSGEDFVATCELVPGRGYTGMVIDNILKFAEEAKDSKYVYGVSLTDNAGGNPALCADILGPEIQSIGPALIRVAAKVIISWPTNAFRSPPPGIPAGTGSFRNRSRRRPPMPCTRTSPRMKTSQKRPKAAASPLRERAV